MPPPSAQGPELARLRILHVEDSETDAALVVRELRRGGYDLQYERVETAPAMKAAIARQTWDAVLADYVLPHFSGPAALAVLHESGLDLPFIIVSGEIGEDVAVASMKAGAHDYVIKGNLTRLVPAVERELREAAMRRERKRAEAELIDRRRKTAMVSEVGGALTHGSSLPAMLQLCAEAVVLHLDVVFARIWTLDEEGSVLVLQASAGRYTRLDGFHSRVPVGESSIGLIARERKPHLSNRVVGDPSVAEQEWAKREGMVAFAGYPLIVESRVVGVIAVFAQRPLTELSFNALAAVADEIALGIHRKLAEVAQQEEAQVSGALARMGDGLIAALATPLLLNRLCALTTEVLGCDLSGTLLWHPRESVYVLVASHGLTPEQWEVGRVVRLPGAALAGLLAQLQSDDIVRVALAESPHPLIPQLGTQLQISVGLNMALRRGGGIVGIQIAGYRDRQASFSRVQERIARGIAHLASLALENARVLEELEHASRLKSDFVATMSHELRTPLHVITGYNELLREGEFGPLNAGQVDALRRIQKSADGLLELITATLDLSRLETGQAPLEVNEIALPDLIGEIDTEVRDLREKPTLSFEWKLQPQLPRLVTDRVKLKVVLKNLISNAMKFTERGGVTVSVRTRDGGVAFDVSDTGIGISPVVLPDIFDLFRQAERSDTRRYGGVGLGLYIVRRLLDLLGGTVTVDTVVGRGSTFGVWLPVKAPLRPPYE